MFNIKRSKIDNIGRRVEFVSCNGITHVGEVVTVTEAGNYIIAVADSRYLIPPKDMRLLQEV